MITTFKETLTSLRDPKYGQEIIKKPVKAVLWYWTKYLILVSLIPLTLIIFFVTRFLPQLPRLMEDRLPEGVLEAKNGQLSSTITQPYEFKSPPSSEAPPFVFIFDLEATPSAAESFSDGLLVLKDQIIIKSSDGSTQIQTFENLPDFSVDKYQIADWLRNHRYQIWFAITALITVISIITVIFYLLYRLITFLIWTGVFLLVDRYWLKKSLAFRDIFNLVVYASVLPLLLSVVLFIAPNNVLTLMNIFIIGYLAYSWIRSLPDKSRS